MASHGAGAVGVAEAFRIANEAILDAIAGRCAAVKPQTACYEAYGAPGWAALEATVARFALAPLDVNKRFELYLLLRVMDILDTELPDHRRRDDLIRTNRAAVASAALLTMMILACVIVPWASSWDYAQADLDVGPTAPSWAHWMGTDYYGRDLLARVFFGGRVSFAVGTRPSYRRGTP